MKFDEKRETVFFPQIGIFCEEFFSWCLKIQELEEILTYCHMCKCILYFYIYITYFMYIIYFYIKEFVPSLPRWLNWECKNIRHVQFFISVWPLFNVFFYLILYYEMNQVIISRQNFSSNYKLLVYNNVVNSHYRFSIKRLCVFVTNENPKLYDYRCYKIMDWPWQYSFPPFFTLQPHAPTREKQIQAWKYLVISYCQVGCI